MEKKSSNTKNSRKISQKANLEENRFKMVKERHRKTFEEALAKGKMDEKLVNFCKYVSSTRNYFTSSCCSGRILLLRIEGNDRDKRNCHFHRKWHDIVSLSEVLAGINEDTKGRIWFKVEPFILHLGCKDLENAKKILEVMKLAGIKRGGIIVAKEGKFMVEFMGTQEMSFLAKEDDAILVDKGYLENAVNEANRKMTVNEEMLIRLEKEVRKKLK
ncbi:MAG: hypothetical protein COT15_01450 [Candidatus Diapherotrites archaeon CG08_land_8_20_14_0_20_34_12]|nr:MAG: hypothetical protein COT15_01450 [Candidatus Diapherotrites archaeon CG08_land_8_20_14_0_20_34_12]